MIKKEGLFKRLKNIENAQKKSDNSDDNSEYFTPKSWIDSKYDEDEDENENEKLSVIFIRIVLRVWKVLNCMMK